MKNIFELEEGKTYNVKQGGSHLNRKFRVKNGKLENDGLGRFAPCDWAPINAKVSFTESTASNNPLSKGINKFFSWVFLIFSKKQSGVSLLNLKENIIYKSNNRRLPSKIIRKGDQLFNAEPSEIINLKKIKLSTQFIPLGFPEIVPQKISKTELL